MDNYYHYRESGLSNIFLKNGFDVIETSFGKSVRIQHVEALHEAIGLFIVKSCSRRIDGEMLKFLRTQLNMTQKIMGESLFLHADSQTVANWEKRRLEAIPAQAEILLRSFYMEAKSGTSTHVTSLLERFADEDCDNFHARRIEFKNFEGEWQEQLCA